MNLSKTCLWAWPLALPLGLLSSLGSAAFARTINLKVLPLNAPSRGCPTALVAYETSRPQTLGGYAIDGMIQLQAIATNISATQRDQFSATWVGTLKPEYSNCTASAGMSMVDGVVYPGNSYLRVQMTGGQVKVVLDMTGMPDANDFTATLLEQTVRDGNPRWAWGGTD